MVQELFGGSNISPAAAPPPENLRCPRCDSSNTKFCYYNNYNLTQPRHFCKTCRRYWTKGGALRNVPIGGGCRKNKISAVTPKLKTASFDSNSNPIIWASSQNSNFLSLIRSNPVKEELSPASLFPPPHVSPDSLHPRLDQMGPAQAHLPFYRNQTMYGGDQNGGLQEAYQRLRSTSNSCYADHAPLILESSPVAPGHDQFGVWNNIPNLSWPTDSGYL